MYLQIYAQTINEFDDFATFMKHRLRFDLKQNAAPVIYKVLNASSMKELIAILSNVYEGISYQKVIFPLTDLENVLMWVNAELELPELTERLAMLYAGRKKEIKPTRKLRTEL